MSGVAPAALITQADGRRSLVHAKVRYISQMTDVVLSSLLNCLST
jgi:hypothetical protein